MKDEARLGESYDQRYEILSSGRFARGWHCLGAAGEFCDGRVHGVYAFGTKLAVFEKSPGTFGALTAPCPHMGADLSAGFVKDGVLVCPFHQWHWSGDGRCQKIPYAAQIPSRARAQHWHTAVKNDQLFVWHDPENEPPTDEVEIPHIPECNSPEWSEWIWDRAEIDSTPLDVVDNVADYAHFFYIHGFAPSYFKNEFVDHTAAQYLEIYEPGVKPKHDPGKPYNGSAIELVPGMLRSEGTYFGPSYMIARQWRTFTTVQRGFEAQKQDVTDAVIINCHYPISKDKVMLQMASKIKLNPGLSNEENHSIASTEAQGFREAFFADIPIWNGKSECRSPVLCSGDGPINQLRKWYSQFYVDRPEVSHGMTRRFEYTADLEAVGYN